MQNNQQPSQPPSSLYRIEFNNSSAFLSEDQMKAITNLTDLRKSTKEIVSLEKIKGINEQPGELDNLYFEVNTNSEILKSLVSNLYKLQDKKEDYIKLLNSTSHFLYELEQKIKSVRDNLNSILEYEGEKE